MLRILRILRIDEPSTEDIIAPNYFYENIADEGIKIINMFPYFCALKL